MRSIARMVGFGVLLGATACSSFSGWRNPPLSGLEAVQYDGRAAFVAPTRERNLIVVASFSGGGSRAAALAHGVTTELDKIEFDRGGRSTTLAREIDMVTGVSGGSVAAAHLALHGAQSHIRTFEEDFLGFDFQGKLISSAFSPRSLYRLGSRRWGRGHHLAQKLDERLFQGARFGDLAKSEHSPYLIVGATDVATGAEFDFASDQMDSICSNVDEVPLSFAVAASSAVPLIFSPLTLTNHTRDCPRSDGSSPASASSDLARDALVLEERGQFAGADKRFIHLVDGGLSDNLGLRRIADYVPQAGGITNVVEQLIGAPQGSEPLTVVFIAVDAERRDALPIESSEDVPTSLEVLDAVVYGGLGRYSRETSLVFHESVRQWREELALTRGTQVDVFLVELRLADLEDLELRRRAFEIPTAFRISVEDRQLVTRAARRLVTGSKELARLTSSLSQGR